MKRVTAGREYRYEPAGMDRWDARTSLRSGDLVTVVKLRGCPPPNTMGHAHVNGPDGRLAGLVLTSSLQPKGST